MSTPVPNQMKWLRRTQSGLPVPYVVHWTGEEGTAFLLEIGFQRKLALCHEERPGVGSPILGKMSFMRQREVLLKKRCQVCRRPLPRHQRFTVFDSKVLAVSERQESPLLMAEPPACRSCMLWVQHVCPGVRERTIVKVGRYRLIASMVAPVRGLDNSAFEPLSEADFPGEGAIGYLKYTPESWARAKL